MKYKFFLIGILLGILSSILGIMFALYQLNQDTITIGSDDFEYIFATYIYCLNQSEEAWEWWNTGPTELGIVFSEEELRNE